MFEVKLRSSQLKIKLNYSRPEFGRQVPDQYRNRIKVVVKSHLNYYKNKVYECFNYLRYIFLLYPNWGVKKIFREIGR